MDNFKLSVFNKSKWALVIISILVFVFLTNWYYTFPILLGFIEWLPNLFNEELAKLAFGILLAIVVYGLAVSSILLVRFLCHFKNSRKI